MRWDRWMYLMDSTTTERHQLVLGGIYIHLKINKPIHQAMCGFAKNFITRDKEQVTCQQCLDLIRSSK